MVANIPEWSFCTNCFKCFQWPENLIRRSFAKLGRTIGTNPWPFLLTPIFISLICMAGFINFKQVTDVRYQFTPTNSRAFYENSVALEFIEEFGDQLHVRVIIKAKDEGNLLRLANGSVGSINYVREVLKVIDRVTNLVKIPYGANSTNFRSYAEVCSSFCNLNDATSQFFNLRAIIGDDPTYKSLVQLNYPKLKSPSAEVYVANNLVTVQVQKDGTVSSVKTVVLHYSSVILNATARSYFDRWDNLVNRRIGQLSETLDLRYFSQTAVSEETARTAVSAGPLLALSFLVIVCFTLISTWRSDPVRRKSMISICGVISPIVASFASFGLLAGLSVFFQPLCTATMFLVLAVGVDDVYLMLHAWKRTDTHLSAAERMESTMRHSGPSITITSLTNALSFGVGLLSYTPAVRVFCTYTVLAIVSSYLAQITFFAALMTFSGRREERGERGVCFCSCDSNSIKSQDAFLRQINDSAINSWCRMLQSSVARVLFVIGWIVYIAIAVIGFVNMKADLQVEKVLLKDSYLHPTLEVSVREIDISLSQFALYINRPGDLRDKAQRHRITSLVEELETAPYSWGNNATSFWLRDYQNYQGFLYETVSDEVPFIYDSVMPFLSTNAQYRHFIRGNQSQCTFNHPDCVQSFVVTIGFHNVTSYAIRAFVLDNWRRITDSYSDLNATTYNNLNFFSDQVASMASNATGTILIALVSMAVVCIFFIPNLMSVVIAIASVLSVNIGVFGYLSWWNVDLDPLSMTALLVSVGYSVDLTAHISYHYYVIEAESISSRLVGTLQAIGWPLIQSGLSALLAMIVLSLHQSYLLSIFFKTMVLVVVLGVSHALFGMPVVLAWMPDCLQPINNVLIDKNNVIDTNRENGADELEKSEL